MVEHEVSETEARDALRVGAAGVERTTRNKRGTDG